MSAMGAERGVSNRGYITGEASKHDQIARGANTRLFTYLFITKCNIQCVYIEVYFLKPC